MAVRTLTPVANTTAAPARRGRLILLSVLGGLIITAAWSAPFVDQVVGFGIASAVLGHDPSASIAGSLAGLVFAFAAGMAGSFTACNIAAFSAMAPMVAGASSARSRIGGALRPLGWVALGALPVAGIYGAVGVLIGGGPQLSAATVGGMPVRLIQSSVVYGVIGIVFVAMGLAALRVVPDPFGRLTARFPQAPMVIMGVLIGLFLVGRPYPLFKTMFEYAVATSNPFYGALSFLLVAVGNIVLMGVLFVVLALAGGARLQRWLSSRPGRIAAITGCALLVAGVFTLAYWDIRLPSLFGYGWFPVMPWV